MGEAKRKASSGAKRLTAKYLLEMDAAARVSDERCVIQINVLRKHDLLGGLMSGSKDPALGPLLGIVAEFLTECVAHQAGRGPLCLACNTEFSARLPPTDFLLTTPQMLDVSKNRPCLVTGICARCAAQTDEQLMAAGLRWLRRVWPNMQPTGKGGTA
jgi:hypothetical protein